MIVPNLAVRDIARSVQFYRDTIGMTLTMTVSPEREVGWPGEIEGASCATLEWDDCQLMLQTVASLADELEVFEPDHTPIPSGNHLLPRPAPRYRAGPSRPRGCRQGTTTELVRHDRTLRPRPGRLRHLHWRSRREHRGLTCLPPDVSTRPPWMISVHSGQKRCSRESADSPYVRTSAQTSRRHRLPRAREPYTQRAVGLLRRQRCGPMRAADIPPATEPLSASVRRQR